MLLGVAALLWTRELLGTRVTCLLVAYGLISLWPELSPAQAWLVWASLQNSGTVWMLICACSEPLR